MLKPDVLLVTHRKAYECDSIIDGLKCRGINYFRFNLDLEDSSKISVDYQDPLKVYAECDEKDADITDVKLAYFHQTLPEKLYQNDNNQAIRQIRRSALIQSIFALEDLLAASWINKPSAVQAASNKLSQLKVAKSLGLSIPRSLVSNQPQRIAAFTERTKTIVKTVASPKYFSDSTESDYFEAETVHFDAKLLEEPEELTIMPLIYQEAVKKVRELRVVVLGERVFAAYCEASESHLDYRTRTDLVEVMRPCIIPAPVIAKLKEMLAFYLLQYGSFDLLVDDKGEHIFLELNPTGAFGWIDKAYNGDIYKAFAQHIKSSI